MYDPVVMRKEPIIQQVIEWAEINSGTSHQAGVARLAEAVLKAAEPLNADIQRFPLAPASQIDEQGELSYLSLTDLVRLQVRPHAPVQILLCGHLDTVYSEESPFQKCSFLPSGRLNGPGVADMKGGVAILFAALKELERSPNRNRIGWRVLLNPDEEIGSPGSAPFIQAEARSAHLALIFEPCLPSGKLVSSRKGSANLTLVARGVSAHVGRNPEEGRSAINGLIDALQEIRKLADEETLVNLGRIAGGRLVNQVADRAICRFNLRSNRLQDRVADLQKLVGQLDGRNDIRLSLHGEITRPPKPFDEKSRCLFEQIRGCGQELGIEIEWEPTGGVCDGNLVAAQGIPVVDTLGGRGGSLHTADEWLDPDSLMERTSLTALFLCKLASGEFSWPS
jgi:glutamate carboxypeptidase